MGPIKVSEISRTGLHEFDQMKIGDFFSVHPEMDMAIGQPQLKKAWLMDMDGPWWRHPDYLPDFPEMIFER